MIRGGAQASAEERSRFQAEAEAVARLQHPNIVQIYEVGEQGGQPYLCLEFVPGGSLAQKIAGAPLTRSRCPSITAFPFSPGRKPKSYQAASSAV